MTPKLMRGETQKQYNAFCAYYDMGEQRSLRKLIKPLGIGLSMLAMWSKRYNWPQRVYDVFAEEQELKRKTEEEAKRAIAEERERLKLDVESFALEMFTRGKAKLDEMLKWPTSVGHTTREEKDANGNVITQHITFMPSKWSMRTIPVFAQTITDMARLALGMHTSHQRVSDAEGKALAPAVQPIITVIHHQDEQSKAVRRIRDQFAADHPDDPAVRGHNGD